jgi:hypothetical protein
MSKATETRATIQDYILSVVDSSGFEKCETREEKISFLKSRFFSEYGHYVKQQGEQRAVIGWLQGLALDIEFYNVKIIELMDSWRLVKHNAKGDISEKSYDKALDEYWNRLSMAILMMFKELK